jgi:hypothetical protein
MDVMPMVHGFFHQHGKKPVDFDWLEGLSAGE